MKQEILHEILTDAMRAPSGDNYQNWKIGVDDNGGSFSLMAEEVVGDFFDTKGFATYFSCGCFLKNVEIAALQRGFEAQVKIRLKGGEIAKVSFVKSKRCGRLYDEIFRRRTCRNPYNKKEFGDEFYRDVKELFCEGKGVQNVFVRRGEKGFWRLVNILYEIETLRMFNKTSIFSTRHMVRFSKKDAERGDGLDYRLLGVPVFQKIAARIAFDWRGLSIMKKVRIRIPSYISSKRLLKTSSGVGCIFVDKGVPCDFVKAGMFFQELWLIITKHSGVLQPFASLPFFGMKVEFGDIEGFDEIEQGAIVSLRNRLFRLVGLSEKKKLAMIYRYGFSKKKDGIRSFRKGLDEIFS